MIASLDYRSEKPAGFAVRPTGCPEDFGDHGVKGKDSVGETGIGDRARHSPHSATWLVLSQYAASAVANDAASDQAIGTHAGEDNCRHAGAKDLRRRAKQHVDGGPAVIL
jgi:hypothetical protein